MSFSRTRSVHILDRLIPELEANVQLDDLGVYLISEGLITGEEHLMLARCPSRTEAVIELVQKIKHKGPCSLQSFLTALRRSCNNTVPPHMGHVHLLELFQSNIDDTQLPKQTKSKSVLSLLGWTKRGKKVKKDIKTTSAEIFQKESSNLQLHPKRRASTYTLNVASDEDSTLFSQSQPTTEMDLTLPSSQDSMRDSYLTDPHSDQLPNVRFSLHNTPYTNPSSKPSDGSSDIPVETTVSDSTEHNSDESGNEVLLKEMKHKVKELEHEIKQKNKQVEMYKATVKELMIKYEQIRLKSDSAEHKILDLKDDNRILQYQLTEASKQAKEDESIIDNLEYEVKQLHAVLHRVRMERDTMQRYMGSSLGRRRPSVAYPSYQPDSTMDRLSPPSPEPSQSPSNNNGGLQERQPASHQGSVDQLRRELSQKDLALHYKMDQMAQICQDYYDVPIMRRRWHSDYRLGYM